MRRLAVALTVLFVLSTQALAWHDGGHKIVAAIAFRQLTPAKQAAVAKLLKEHPRFNEEFKAKMPHGLDDSAKNEWIFQQAAVFPDIARQYSDDLKAEYHHPSWHYINMPEFLSTEDRMALHPEGNLNLSLDPPASLDEKSNVIQVIRAARKIIADTNTSGEDRALMLSWLFHTVGDIHQPLHSTAFFSRELFPHGDKGGNKVATMQKQNLHSLWDDFPGGRLKFSTVQNRAASLIANSTLATLGNDAAQDLDEKNWLKESQSLAVHLVYDPEVLAAIRTLEATHTDIEDQPIDLSEDYLRAGADAAEKRVVQAGYRLGAILSALVD